MNKKKKAPEPPRWAVRFFRWYCNDYLSEAVLGDMLELYGRRAKTGKLRADLLFVLNAFQFLQPFAFRRKHHTSSNHTAMFRSYLKITWRSMSRQKMYTAVKIGGFSLGLATCMLIALFIRYEVSFDKHYRDTGRIYRVYNDWRKSEGARWTTMPANMASIMKADYPEVELSARVVNNPWYNAGSNLFRPEDQVENTFEQGFIYADQELFQILEIPVIYGNSLHALDKPNTIVLTKSKADRYFPGLDPVGKTVVLNDKREKPFTIGAVIPDFPVTSHLRADFLITLKDVEFWPGEQTNWCCWNYEVYAKLRPGVSAPALSDKMDAIRDKYYVSYLKSAGDQSVADVKAYHHFGLQPVEDIYINTFEVMEGGAHGDLRYVWLFGGIAIFILLLACINFINLATARSANRAREVGLRKVVGSARGSLVRQFLTESMFYSFIACTLAVLLVAITLPYFSTLSGRALRVPWQTWWLLPSMLLCASFIGLVAGVYPSFYLSHFNPVDVLKGAVSRGARSSALRNVLVVFQFTTSIVLIIATFVIYQQMTYILNTKVGFNKDQVIVIHGTNTLDKTKLQTLKNELLGVAGVHHVTATNYLPVGGTHRDQSSYWREGRSRIEESVGAQRWFVDADYVPTMGMKLVAGRNFDERMASDTAAMIINQSMARELGLENPVGERIEGWRIYTIIGVVEDFHFETMRDRIGALCLILDPHGEVMAVKTQTADMPGLLRQVQEKWDNIMPHQPFRHSFMDESYARMYADVQRMGTLFGGFALLAVTIACLGLFALSSFMVEQRGKEISIRLVLGASINNILRLLTSGFVKLVLIAFLLAVPLAWYLMRSWLEEFQYKIDIGWEVFAVAGILSVIIALVTVGYQSVNAALASPAARLRSE